MAFLDNKEVGNRLKAKRKLTNLSARQFAIKAGVDQSQYAKIERGDLPITENIMGKLVKVHGLDEKSILHGMNVPRGTVNGSEKSTEAQHAPNSEKQGLDLIKEVNLLREQIIESEAKFAVIFSELAHLMAKDTGRSHASAEIQLKKDVSTWIENLKTLRGRI